MWNVRVRVNCQLKLIICTQFYHFHDQPSNLSSFHQFQLAAKFVRFIVHLVVVSPCLVDTLLKYVFDLPPNCRSWGIKGGKSIDLEAYQYMLYIMWLVDSQFQEFLQLSTEPSSVIDDDSINHSILSHLLPFFYYSLTNWKLKYLMINVVLEHW